MSDKPPAVERDWASLIYGDRNPTDSDLLDFLDWLSGEMGGDHVVLRESTTGRGWRLHQSGRKGSEKVRDAIVQFMVDRFTRDDDPRAGEPGNAGDPQ